MWGDGLAVKKTGLFMRMWDSFLVGVPYMRQTSTCLLFGPVSEVDRIVSLIFIFQMGKPESTHLAKELGIARAGPRRSGTMEHLHTWSERMPWGGRPEDAMILEDSLELSAAWKRVGA